MNENLKKIKKSLKKELEKDRYEHTVGVMYTACSLAMAHGADIEQAMFAGLLHDCAKCIPNDVKLNLCKEYKIALTKTEKSNPYLIHAKLGAFLAQKEYNITDPEICHAIEVHTTGVPNMNLLDKIIFVADYIEPNRHKADNLTAIRRIAYKDLDLAVYQILGDTLAYLRKGRGEIDQITQETYDYYAKIVNKSV